MFKRLLALIPVLVFVCALSIPVHADSVVSNQDLHFQCSSCSYTASLDAITWVGDSAQMTCPDCGGKLGIYQGKTFIPGGGVSRGGGVGRDVPGYSGDGVANYNVSGILQLVVEPYGFTEKAINFSSNPSSVSSCVEGSSGSGVSYPYYQYFYPLYRFVAPCDGIYFYGSAGSPYEYGTFSYYKGNEWIGKSFRFTSSLYYEKSITLTAGSVCYFTLPGYYDKYLVSRPYRYSLTPFILFVEPLGGSTPTKLTSITINDHSFNGNIYVDNDTNLTYIYPDNSTSCIVYDNTYNQYVTYDQTTNNYYYITVDNNPPVLPTPTPSPTPGPSTVPVGIGDTFSDDVVSGTSISGTVNAKAGDFVLATVSARSALTIPDTMTYLYKGSVFAGNSHNQTMSFAYQQVPEDGTYTYTFSQASVERMYLSLIVLSDVERLQYSGKYHTEGTDTSPYSVSDKADGDMLVWGCSSEIWSSSDTSNSTSWTAFPSDLTYVGGASNSGQSRQANFIDDGSGAVSHSFSFDDGGYLPFYCIDAVEIIPKTVEPTPTPDPGGETPVPSTPPSGGGSGGSGGGSNPLGGLLGALGDLLLGLLQSFLNLIWTLISTILSIFLWCGQQVAVLIPFLPAPALGALLGGIVLVFIIKLIKFIGGLF